MPIRMIVSDLDETLLNDASELTERAQSALRAAMERGALVVLASGRMVAAMLPFARQIGVNAPIIAFNGAATYDIASDTFLSRFTVPADTAKAVCQMAARENLYIQAFIGGQYYFEEENELNRRYGKSSGVSGTAVHTPLDAFIDRDCDKLLMIGEPERITEMEKKFTPEFTGRANLFISRPMYLECTGTEANKGNAVRALAEHFGISPGEICAFGDAQNDLSMLTYAGYGYAVANARPEVIEAVPRKAPPNDEDGVARVIEELLAAGMIGRYKTGS